VASGKAKSVWREYAEAIVISLALAFLIRTFIIQAFKIPSGSMLPTLLVGDHLLVNKFIYRFRPPERNEVVVFKFPKDAKTDFIKRVVGLPGDEIAIKDGVLYVNGRQTADPHAVYGLDGSLGKERSFGPFRVPAKGDIIKPTADNLALYRYLLANELEKPVMISEGRLMVDGQSVDSYQVREDYLLMMGDNRDNSYDSRFWGPVRRKDLVGKALVIYWYWGGDLLEKQRWRRIGSLIR
jgi:signal peptidase I